MTPRALSILELLLLFVGVPLFALSELGHAFRHLLLFVGCAYVVWRLGGHINWRHVCGLPPAGWWCNPVLRGGLVAAGMLAYVLLMEPENLFVLPRERTGLWLLIVFAYPVLSVIPQELIYRVYLFETHRGLWASPRLFVVVSALFFGWMHIVFIGWFAVITTAFGGLLLAETYVRTRAKPGALWIVTLEHALYGLAVFTVGLGKYFFLPR